MKPVTAQKIGENGAKLDAKLVILSIIIEYNSSFK